MTAWIKRLEQSPPLFWLSLALIPRLAFALKLSNGFYQIDESGFHAAAINLASWGVFGSGKTAMAGAPVPAFYLSIFFRLFGDHPFYARLGLLAPSMLLVWIVWKMTENACRSKAAGKIALAVASVYPFFIYYGALMLSEIPYLVFATLGIWQLCQTMEENGASPRRGIAAGAALALAGLSRPEGAVIMAGLWPLALFISRKNRTLLRNLALSCLCWGLILCSWSLRNRLETGSFVLDSHGGLTLLHGTMLFDFNEQDTEVAMQVLRKTPLFLEASRLPAPQRDKLFWKAGIEFMASHPREILRQWARKTVNFWRFYPRTDKLYAETRSSRPNIGMGRGKLVLISLLFEPWIIFGGLWGLGILLWNKARVFYPIPFFIGATFFIHIVSVSQMRYRLPVMPFLILGCSSLLAGKFQSEKR